MTVPPSGDEPIPRSTKPTINNDSINNDSINNDSINNDSINNEAINKEAIGHHAVVESFRSQAIPWMKAERRDLPWRQSRDPWAVHVAESMLQQTQTARVVPKWTSFLERFPTVEDCSNGTVAETIRLWEGLGYNRRAVQLHSCAVRVVEEFSGKFPRDLDSLMQLPGVGPYTARAIMAFAFELDAAVLDTNVARIVSRCIAGRTLRLAEAQQFADSLVPKHWGWAWNQGMLDLGAMVCTKRAPRCDACPVQTVCLWRNAGPGVPDPAVGSAAVTVRQSRFEGSDRQLRGRLVDALRRETVRTADVGRIIDCHDGVRLDKIVRSLIDDGLATHAGDALTLA